MFATPTIENQRRLRALGQPPNHEPLNFNLPMQDDVLTGACSFFGGPGDSGMSGGKDDLDGKVDTGLAFYEPREADLRPDLFLPSPASAPDIATWTRLRAEAPYLAMRFALGTPRRTIQRLCFCVANPDNGRWMLGFAVDRGPSVMSRLVDLSPRFRLLGIDTGSTVRVTLALPGPMGLKALTSWIPGS